MVHFGFMKSFEMETLRDGSCSEKTRCIKRSGSHLELCEGEKTVAWISATARSMGTRSDKRKRNCWKGYRVSLQMGERRQTRKMKNLLLSYRGRSVSRKWSWTG